MTPGTFRHARSQPIACALWLSHGADLWATSVSAIPSSKSVTVFDVRFAPPPQLVDYPDEHVRVVIRDTADIYAVPLGPTRAWKHRYPRLSITDICSLKSRVDWHYLLGALCLWYPEDPPHLRWNWHLGVDAYLRIVQRHLWDEEYNRRHRGWPAEDTPHGHRLDGRPHPVMTESLRRPA